MTEFDDPKSPPAGWNGYLPLYPQGALDPNTPPNLDNVVTGQPAWASNQQPWTKRLGIHEHLMANLAYFRLRGGDMAYGVFKNFYDNHGQPYLFSPVEAERAVLDSAWGTSALFFGQHVRPTRNSEWGDPRGLPDTAMGPYDDVARESERLANGWEGYAYQPGILAEVGDIIARATDDHSLYGKDIPLVVDWMRMPGNASATDNSGVHYSLGHYNIGASGSVNVRSADQVDDFYDQFAPPDSSDEKFYEVRFQGKIWDYYKFDHRPPSGDEDLWPLLTIAENNIMRLAHEAGLARNFISYGTTRDIVAFGWTQEGVPSDSVQYYYADDPGTIFTVPSGATYDVRKKPEEETKSYARGGFVAGPGSSTRDEIPARLSNGEFVVNAAATGKFLPLLEMLNSGWVPSPGFLNSLLYGKGGSQWDSLRFETPKGSLGLLGDGLRPPAKSLELPISGTPLLENATSSPPLGINLADLLGKLFGGEEGKSPDVAASLVQGGLQGFFSGTRAGGLVKGLTGGISGLASAAGGQIGSTIGAALGAAGGPVGSMVGSAIGSTVGSMVGQTASEFVTKPIEYVASTAKELVGGGFGLIDLANGAGADTAKGDIYNFNGMDPKSVSIAVERVNRRRTLAQQRGGGFGR